MAIGAFVSVFSINLLPLIVKLLILPRAWLNIISSHPLSWQAIRVVAIFENDR